MVQAATWRYQQLIERLVPALAAPDTHTRNLHTQLTHATHTRNSHKPYDRLSPPTAVRASMTAMLSSLATPPMRTLVDSRRCSMAASSMSYHASLADRPQSATCVQLLRTTTTRYVGCSPHTLVHPPSAGRFVVTRGMSVAALPPHSGDTWRALPCLAGLSLPAVRLPLLLQRPRPALLQDGLLQGTLLAASSKPPSMGYYRRGGSQRDVQFARRQYHIRGHGWGRRGAGYKERALCARGDHGQVCTGAEGGVATLDPRGAARSGEQLPISLELCALHAVTPDCSSF